MRLLCDLNPAEEARNRNICLRLFHDNDFLNVSEKDRELFAAQGEIKALRGSEALKDKAVEEVSKNHMQLCCLTVFANLCTLSDIKYCINPLS